MAQLGGVLGPFYDCFMAGLWTILWLNWGLFWDPFHGCFMACLWVVLWLNWGLIFGQKKREIGLVSFMEIVATSKNLKLGF